MKKGYLITQRPGKNILGSVPISNNMEILEWFCENISRSFRAEVKTLSDNHTESLKRLFGKANTVKLFEFRTFVFFLDYKGCSFNVFTAKNKGTTIEFVGTYDDVVSGKNNDVFIDFCENLYHLVNDL